jgi:hypothetical protein
VPVKIDDRVILEVTEKDVPFNTGRSMALGGMRGESI